jgi:hypothetical protein
LKKQSEEEEKLDNENSNEKEKEKEISKAEIRSEPLNNSLLNNNFEYFFYLNNYK